MIPVFGVSQNTVFPSAGHLLGYHCTVIASACATRDLPDGRDGIIPAEVVHRANLAALADRFARVVESVDEIPD